MANMNNMFTRVGLITQKVADGLVGFGAKRVIIDLHETNKSDRDSISGDWKKVGKDMRRAIIKYDRKAAK